MIPDYLNSRNPQQPKVEPIVPQFGIGERVVMDNGTTDIYYVTGIIVRGAGLLTYLVSDRGSETEVRDFEIIKWDDLPEANEEDDD